MFIISKNAAAITVNMWILSRLTVFIVLSSYSVALTESSKRAEDTVKDEIIYERYIELDKNLKNAVNSGFKMALPYIMEASGHLNISSSCASNLFTLMTGIKKLKLSALQFLDAAGKIPPGLMTGTINMFGDYDQCLSAQVLRTDGNVAFQGQYCMLEIRQILPKRKGKITIKGGMEDLVEYTKNTSELMQFFMGRAQYGYVRFVKYGLCVPSGCTTEDVGTMLTYLGEKAFINASVEYCDRKDELQMHRGTIVAIIFFSMVGLLTIVGSSMDYYSRKKTISFKKKTERFLVCFSVFTNFPKVLSSKMQDATISSVFGIRILSLFYIILMHQYFLWGVLPSQGHVLLWEDQIPQFFFQIVMNGYLTCEVFFFLGGLVNAYSRMKIHESGKRPLNIFQIFIHRLWRIYPTYLFSMLTFYLFVNSRGPLGTHIKQNFIDTCAEKWWKNLLFINNLFDQEKLCMFHTWYIAADMQLFLMSLFSVPVLLKSSKKGIILHIGIVFAGLAATAVWAWYKDLMPSTLVYYLDQDDMQRVRNTYVTFLPHIAPYFTGVITGYIVSKWDQFKIPRVYRYFGWVVAAVAFISMLFITQVWNSGVEFTLIESALYFAFCRFLFVSAVAWVVICCTRGYGGVINYICSLKIWIPLARISYMVYMVSPILQLHYFATLRMRIDTDYTTLIWRHIGDLGLSCLLGLAMVVIMESPFISMEKLIFNKSPTKKEQSENNVKNSEKYINNDENSKEIDFENNKNLHVSIQLKE